jgi:hypothetical protein
VLRHVAGDFFRLPKHDDDKDDDDNNNKDCSERPKEPSIP